MGYIENLLKEFENNAVIWGKAINEGDHRIANKYHRKNVKIAKKFRTNRNLGELILIPLLDHPEASVRYQASVYALELEIQIEN
jgi:hypothetical protein